MTPNPRNDKAIRWLLDGDPSIRWQVLRDIVGAPERTVEREQRRVAREGWGLRLLARPNRDGRWAGGRSSDGGLYSPKWISTTYTMLLLRDFGLPGTNRQARRADPVRCLYSAEVNIADSSPRSMVQFGPRNLNSAAVPDRIDWPTS